MAPAVSDADVTDSVLDWPLSKSACIWRNFSYMVAVPYREHNTEYIINKYIQIVRILHTSFVIAGPSSRAV